MKFRAVMQNPSYIQELKNLIQTLGKLSKECVLRISANRLVFIVNEESGTSAPLVWMEIDTALYFSEFTMEGVNADNPHIMVAMSTANLVFGLTVLRQSTRYCKLKLIHMQFPCLSIESDSPSQQDQRAWQRLHSVPVELIPRSDWEAYQVPEVPHCQLVLNVPANRLVRGLIDKLKNLSPSTIFYAISNGELNLVAETDMATITTRYKHLEVRSINRDVEPRNDDTSNSNVYIAVSCAVDGKKVALFFAGLQVAAAEVSCGIANDRCIHLQVDVREGVVIHSILPALCV